MTPEKKIGQEVLAPVQELVGPTYVASRASVPGRAELWRTLRDHGWQITSSWIDQAGDGEDINYTDLWDRVSREIAASRKFLLFAVDSDFPLKGALIETGIALAMGKPVVACLPGVRIDERTKRPVGSWLAHRNVTRIDTVYDAISFVPPASSLELMRALHLCWPGNLEHDINRALGILIERRAESSGDELRGCTSLVQRRLQCSYSYADCLLLELEKRGSVSPLDGRGVRRLISPVRHAAE
jgi:hypothetical protein